jgi:chemotaxis methyl-accepting protein methylase/signal transduction histidine kinase
MDKQNLDNRLDRKQKDSFHVVGVGASAGGLRALIQLFEHIPSDIGMAFVLVQHLDPTKKSLLPQTLARPTTLPIIEITDGTKVKPNHIYTMPSESYITIKGNVLQLTPRKKRFGFQNPIDSFFQSLAKYHGKDAIGIILSGTGSDGTAGIQAIKGNGGGTFAQDDSAQFKDMPRSAIDSGSVDFILPPDGIAPALIQISREIKSGPAKSKPEEDNIGAVLTLLKTKSGIDFLQYRQTTVNRCIQRRMFLNHVATAKDYTEFLKQNPIEVEALYKDMLIHVTSFFREPDQYEALKKSVFPAMLKNKSPKRPFTVWVPGCASGEEVYSIAIALQEFFASKAIRPTTRILGTDIAKSAIAQASKGVYKESIAKHISPKRLRQFFTKVTDGYKVKKSIRDMCEFAVADVTQQPPQLDIDLISCRNTLIYLGDALRQKALFMLSSALKPEGFLLLGKSESLGRSAKLFSRLDTQQRIYSKKAPTPATDNLRKAINAQTGRGSTPLVSQKIITTQSDDPSQTPRQEKIIKLKEVLALTQDYSNEIISELDVVNEKLQSANEELASNSEELQSTNEEMMTLSEELQTRNEDVTVALDYVDAIIRTVRGPLLVLNKDLRIISANEAFYNAFKVAANDTENRLLYDLGNRQWNIPKLKTLLEKILPKSNTLTDYEVVHDFKDIGQKTMLLNARTLQQGPNKTSLILLAIEDITERKQLEQQKDEFISIASHELKTPITSVKAYTQILGQRFRKAKDIKSVELAEKMDTQLDKLTDLIGDLLDITMLEAGRIQYHESYFDFNELVEETVEELQWTTEKHRIAKQLQPTRTVYGDHGRLGQVITNFMTNAIKYSPHADKIIVKTVVDKDNVTLCVQDFGVGLSQEDQAKVFERFYRVGGPDQVTYPGLGLGLYISSEIIKRHKGRVWVESKPGKGSTFCFSLPIAKQKLKQPKKYTR